MPNAHGVVQSVANIKGGIGYVPLSYVDSTVKVLTYIHDEKKASSPSIETIQTKQYPLCFSLYYYYFEENSTKLQSFINIVTSSQGKTIIQSKGYVISY